MYVFLPPECRFPNRTEEGTGFPRARITGSYELPCACWEPNLNLLQEWQVFLTAELSLQPLGLGTLSFDLFCECACRGSRRLPRVVPFGTVHLGFYDRVSLSVAWDSEVVLGCPTP